MEKYFIITILILITSSCEKEKVSPKSKEITGDTCYIQSIEDAQYCKCNVIMLKDPMSGVDGLDNLSDE